MSRSVHRASVVAAAACALLALGAGSASADQPPAGEAAGHALGAVTQANHATHESGAVRPAHRSPVPSLDEAVLDETATAAAPHAQRSLTPGLTEGRGGAETAQTTATGVPTSAEGAGGHVAQEAGQAVSEAYAAPADTHVGAVPGLPAQAAAPSAPGLPEDLVIAVPEVVPGVPSFSVIPASLPALPVTPGVPSL